MMALSLLLLLAWAVFGFDSTIDNIFVNRVGAEGVGLHYSTLHALAFLFYVSIVNFEVGGFRTLKHLFQEMKEDMINIIKPFRRDKVVFDRDIKYSSFLSYPYAFVFAGCLVFFALFIFEYPYVFMLNYFHYDSLWFPIYLYNADPISPTFIRNTIGVILPIIPLMLFTKGIGAKIRLNKKAGWLIFIFILSFGIWATFPSTQPYKTIEDIDTNLEGNITVWPNQELFPQTIYIYLNITDTDSGYHERKDLDGWYQVDHYVHTINVWTKYAVFFAVGFIFMIRPKEFVSLEVKENAD